MADVPLFDLGDMETGAHVNLLSDQQENGEVTQNSVNQLLAIWKGRALVESKADSPSVSTEGTVYRVGASASGSFTGFTEDNLAIALEAEWKEWVPIPGVRIYQVDTGQLLDYTTAWVEKVSSVEASVTASTTQTQGQQPITQRVTYVSVVANANDVVTLPTAIIGGEVVIINRGANALQVFPASSDQIDDLTVDSGTVTLAVNEVGRFYAVTAAKWFSAVAVPA